MEANKIDCQLVQKGNCVGCGFEKVLEIEKNYYGKDYEKEWFCTKYGINVKPRCYVDILKDQEKKFDGNVCFNCYFFYYRASEDYIDIFVEKGCLICSDNFKCPSRELTDKLGVYRRRYISEEEMWEKVYK